MGNIIDFFQRKLKMENDAHSNTRAQERKETRNHLWKEEESASPVTDDEISPEEIMRLSKSDKQQIRPDVKESTVDMRLGLDVENAQSLLPDGERIILPVYTKRGDVLGDYEVDASRAIERWKSDLVRVYRVFNDVSGEALPVLATESEAAAYRAAEEQNASESRKTQTIFFH